MPLPTRLALYVALLLLTQCSKCKNDPTPTDPASQLPPATQTGAGTFGCLVNGQPYTPKGNNGMTNFAVLYEPQLNGATLNILTYRIDGRREYINLFCGPITPQKRTFTVGMPNIEATISYDGFAGEYSSTDGGYQRGQITITRLDEQAGILSGTFEFTSVGLKGDTLKVTQGRFDSKL
jgi:hypothetical protein